MKKLFAITLLLGVSLGATAQAPQSMSGMENGLHREFLKSILKNQSVRPLARGKATSKRILSESNYSVFSEDVNIQDSARYIYSGEHGSRFDYNYMQFDKYTPVTTVFGDAYRLTDADIHADSMIIWGTANDEGSFKVLRIKTASYNADDNLTMSTEYQNQITYMDAGNRIALSYDPQGHISNAMEFVLNNGVWDTVQRKLITYDGAGRIIADTMKTYYNGNWSLDHINTYQYDASGNLIYSSLSGWYDGSWDIISSYYQTYYSNNMLKTSTVSYNDHITGMIPFSKDSIAYDPGNSFYTYYEMALWNKNVSAWINSARTVKTLNAQGLPDSSKYYVWYNGPASYRLTELSTYTYDADGDPIMSEQFNFPLTGLPESSGRTNYYYTQTSVAPSVTISSYNCDGKSIEFNSTFMPARVAWQLNGSTLATTYPQWSLGTTAAGGTTKGNAANELNNPASVFVAPNGDMYIADKTNNRIQKWTPGAPGAATIAGGNGGGNALNQLNDPMAVSVINGSVYVLDKNNRRVVKWVEGAGSGTVAAGGHGLGSGAGQLNAPSGFFVTAAEDIYIADEQNNRIQKWTPGATTGVTVAGSPSGTAGAGLNTLDHPTGIFVTANGDMYIADKNNNRIVKWAAGAVSGSVVAGGNGAGDNLNQFNGISSVWVDGGGAVYATDMLNHRIMRWLPGATEGTVIAGGNGAGASSRRLNKPGGLFLDGNGTLYVADQSNYRIQTFAPSIDNSFKVYAAGDHTVSATGFGGAVLQSNTVTVSSNANATSGSSEGNHPDGAKLDYIRAQCKKIATIADAAGGNVLGQVKASIYLDPSVQTFDGRPYTKRHYDIQAASDGAAIVTLYVNPGDFITYNTYVTTHGLSMPLLPKNSTDLAGASHIYITQFTGASTANTTGPGNEYDATQKLLIPNSSITTHWNGTTWELTFPVSSLSGGFFIHSGNVAMKTQPLQAETIMPEDNLDMTVYPNPTSGNVTITVSGFEVSGTVEVLDMTAKVLMKQPVSTPVIQLDLSGFSAGMYLVKYTDGTHTRIIKTIKQ